MIKSRTSGSDADETARYEISHGGYVTVDDEVALPNYLVNLPIQNDIIT